MSDNPVWPTALFLSAHLDDVAFSCGATVAAFRRRGWNVVVATAFTASVPDPRGFALSCQLDKGLASEDDYMAIRRSEDAAFGLALEVDELVWLGLPEAPHRGYGSAPELFAEIRPDDEIAGELAGAIRGLVDRTGPGLIFAPQAIGGHVDHRQLVRAVLGLRSSDGPIAWYRDLPYAESRPDALADPDLPGGLIERPVVIAADDMDLKLLGCACYATQIAFQFGDPDAMRRRLRAFASREATRLAADPYAEAMLVEADGPWGLTMDRSA